MSNKHLVVFNTGNDTKEIEVDYISTNNASNKCFTVSRTDGDFLSGLGYMVIKEGTWSIVLIKPYDEHLLIIGVYPIIGGVAVGKPKRIEEPKCFDCKGTISKEGICFCNRETLEEAAERLFPDSNIQKRIFIKGAKSDVAKKYWYKQFKFAD